jgi:hypothetical protein
VPRLRAASDTAVNGIRFQFDGREQQELPVS